MAAASSPQARRRNVAIALVVVALLLLGLVALTSIDRSEGVLEGMDPVATVRAAPAKVAGKRMRAAFAVGTGGAVQIQVSQNGVFDLAAKRADVAVTGLGSSVLRIVSDGPTIYVKAAKPFSSKPWGKLDSEEAGPLASGVGQVSGNQIGTLLEVLAKVQTATDRGTDKLGTETMRRYSSTVPVAELAEISPVFAQAGATRDADLDVLLDRAGAPRRIVLSAEASATKVQLSVTITDIGKPGAVDVPAAADVADIQLGDLAAVLRG